jgi:hypothetical protein
MNWKDVVRDALEAGESVIIIAPSYYKLRFLSGEFMGYTCDVYKETKSTGRISSECGGHVDFVIGDNAETRLSGVRANKLFIFDREHISQLALDVARFCIIR